MAYPKTPEELKIYKELLEKYKDDRLLIDQIKFKAKDETDKESWEDAKYWFDLIGTDEVLQVCPPGSIATAETFGKKQKNQDK